MRFLLAATCAAGLLLSVNSAQAVGCLSGAVAGGVAGHYAHHHGVIGAMAGCAYGHHLHKEQQRKKAEQEKDKQNHAAQ
ncbi:MAG TPA: hypothetical protein VKV96_04290 [Roseiarcus sp.]|nr:hypothetical protein [Roseiarcus sp.]